MSKETSQNVELFLVSECLISIHADIPTVLLDLSSERATGSLRIEFMNGGIRQISLSKKTRAPKSAKTAE